MSYIGGALAHQQLPRTTTPRVQGQPLRCIIETMPTDAQLGEHRGREMAAGWSYEQCRDWLEDDDARDDAAPECDRDRQEYRAGLRLGVAVRMAERADDPVQARTGTVRGAVPVGGPSWKRKLGWTR